MAWYAGVVAKSWLTPEKHSKTQMEVLLQNHLRSMEMTGRLLQLI
jgi:hypothetical protein